MPTTQIENKAASKLGMSSTAGEEPAVVVAFRACLEDPNLAIPVAAIKVLTNLIKECEASTMMELEVTLRAAGDQLKQCTSRGALGGRTHISLESGIELFLRYCTRGFLDFPDFAVCKAQLIIRGERFYEVARLSRSRIAGVSHSFVQDGATVLTHGYSRVVLALLGRAAMHEDRQFSVIVTEGRPNGAGARTAAALAALGVPCTLVLDSAVGHVMGRVDLVVVGAEGVVENGGIVNMIGTYQMAIVAKAHNKPFYAAAESYKFARLYPLDQRDLPETTADQAPLTPMLPTGGALVPAAAAAAAAATAAAASAGKCAPAPASSDAAATSTRGAGLNLDSATGLPACVALENPTCDFTPPEYLTLLFTDLGVLTPSAVSDELIKLYQ